MTLETQEFAFSSAQFEEIRRLLYARAGIALTEHKQSMVYARLARRLRSLNMGDFSDYLRLLHAPQGEAEWQSFINALTTNLTSFFREDHHFQALGELLPIWQREYGQVRLWCAAASTGEEAYSMAITAVESLGGLQIPLRITATDIDTEVLHKAESATYPLSAIDALSLERKRTFFLRGRGAHLGYARVRAEIRALIDFCQLNLLDPPWPLSGPFDAIFCRNVFIYFDKATQNSILRRFAELLRPQGRLFVGHSEVLNQVADLWQPCGRTIYRLRRI